MKHVKKILLIDGDDIVFALLQKIFLYAGFSPLWVNISRGEDAITYLTNNDTPDIIFIEPAQADIFYDHILDKLNTLNMFNKTKVCILTTLAQNEMAIIADNYLIFKKFTKPFRENNLAELFA